MSRFAEADWVRHITACSRVGGERLRRGSVLGGITDLVPAPPRRGGTRIMSIAESILHDELTADRKANR